VLEQRSLLFSYRTSLRVQQEQSGLCCKVVFSDRPVRRGFRQFLGGQYEEQERNDPSVSYRLSLFAQAVSALAETVTLACSRGPGYVILYYTFDMEAKTVKHAQGGTFPTQVTA